MSVPSHKLPEYPIWCAMKRRCLSKASHAYKDYGGRGITVCERWQRSFADFLADMGPRPGPLVTLDRIDNDGNYEPGNCRWATRSEQARNRRSCIILEFNGERLTLVDWAERYGMERYQLEHRVRLGWPLERALAEPIRPTALSCDPEEREQQRSQIVDALELAGSNQCEAARLLGMSRHMLRTRLKNLGLLVGGGRLPST